MITIADLDVEQLKNHLITGGFFDPFTDIFGNSQPAPTRQMNELDTTNLGNKRVIMIRNTGGISNPRSRPFYKERMMMIGVVGLVGESDSVIAQGLAESIERYLVNSYKDTNKLFSVQSQGVSGPFLMDDGRRAYEVNIICSFNIDR